MHRRWILPFLIVVFGCLSVVGLRSIAPSLSNLQVVFFLIGGLVFGITAQKPFSWWVQQSPFMFIGLIISLIITLIFADRTRGAVSWITVAGINLQFSQLAIPIGALTATWLMKHPLQLFQNFLVSSSILMIPAGLIAVQPDFGTASVYVIAIGSFVFLATQNNKIILGSAVSGISLLLLAWLFFLQPYQKERIYSFLAQHGATNQEVSYQAQQSLIAVGSGQLFGRGLGQGIQSHLRFLPERQTDFIFASLAEELGLAGSILIISLYIVLIGMLFYIAEHTTDTTEQWFLYAILAMTLFQTTINIGMNIGLVPITGVTLPLISYGGSSVISLCYCYGLVESIAKNQRYRASLSFG